MAYPTITYDATNGSDTAPSDAVASGGSASGTGAANSIALGETKDLSDCAQDDSDYIWCETTAGERHLFQITGVTGTWGAATAVTVNEAIGATTFSGADWHINGARETLTSDTTNGDLEDMCPGWIYDLDGTFTMTGDTQRMLYNYGTFGASDPAATIRTSSSASQRAVIRTASVTWPLRLSQFGSVRLEGLKILHDTGTSPGSQTMISDGTIVAVDCVFDGGGLASTLVNVQTFAVFIGVGCYFTGGTTTGISTSGNQATIKLLACVIDGNGNTDFSTCGVGVVGSRYTTTIDLQQCLIFDCDGDGVNLYAYQLTTGTIVNNTIVDNDGNGVEITGTAGSSLSPGYVVANNVIAYNGAYGVSTPTAGSEANWFDYNAVYSNTSGAYTGSVVAGSNDVTLTGDPFVHRASNNYALNDTAGAGAACREVAYPANLPSGA